MTALEALACGLRVVSTENEGLMELLGDDVNRSGAIEYVPLPRMETLDKIWEEDMGIFIEGLTSKLLMQIGRVEKGKQWDMEVEKSLQGHSWAGISKRALEEIEDAWLCCEGGVDNVSYWEAGLTVARKTGKNKKSFAFTRNRMRRIFLNPPDHKAELPQKLCKMYKN